MTQIVVTLDKIADENFLRRMIENMKCFVKTTLRHTKIKENKAEKSDFMETLQSIKNLVDPSVIDMSDPRTKYIMSK